MMEIALITANTAEALGLEALIRKAAGGETVVRRFRDFAAFIDDTPDMYRLCFISSLTFLNYNAFFASRSERTVVLVHEGPGRFKLAPQDIRLLYLEEEEQKLGKKLACILRGEDARSPVRQDSGEDFAPLSAREVEVLVLLCKGFINKEIADRLCISLTTVITHRKNLTAKLGIKSLGGLTLYAVMNGYIEADRL